MRFLPGPIACLACLAACVAADPGLRVADPHAATPADIDRADLTFTGGGGLPLHASAGGRALVRTREPGRPIVLYGHSLGGLAIAPYAIERHPDVAGVVPDEATALLGLRIGRDRGYRSTVRAGAGPFVAVTYRNLGGRERWGITRGGELWGGT